jgi:hypothetical protein
MTPATPIPMDRLVRVYRRIRDEMSALTQKYDNEIEVLRAQLDEVSSAMKDQMRASGSTSTRTPYGTVVLQVKTRYAATDWDGFKEFIFEHHALDLLEKRIAQGNMKQFLEENPGVMPPGLNSFSEFEISVRKPSK